MHCRNSLCVQLFEKWWNDLQKKYPMAKDYLLRALNYNCKSWARAYLHKIFTAGIESTARVEGYNWIIKKELKLAVLYVSLQIIYGQSGSFSFFFARVESNLQMKIWLRKR